MMIRRTAFSRFTMSTLSFFFATGIVQVNAQDRQTEDIEEVTVTGFRSSLGNAVDAKRISKNITDNIFAEDIGKSADQNIAEALSRVTGVSLNRADGEGTSISIRGAAPNLNNISVNGVLLTSGGSPGASGSSASQDFVDLSAFSSDILSKVEVYKTASADLDEGSLGGTVILHTFKPLDAKQDRRALEYQFRENDLAEHANYKLSGGFSQKFFDDRFGIHVTGFKETHSLRKDQVEAGRFKTVKRPANTSRDQNGNLITTDVTGLEFDRLSMQAFENERNRVGGTLSLQFRPSDRTDITLDYTYSDQRVKGDNNNLTVGGPDDNKRPTRGEIIGFYDTANNPFLNLQYSGERNIETGLTEIPAWLTPESATPDQDGNGDPFPDGYNIIYPQDSDDPKQQWNVFNTETAIWEKRTGRFATARSGRSTEIVDTENIITNLDISHTVGALTLDLKLGYSNTETTDNRNQRVTTNNFNSIDATMLAGVSADNIEPIGYDCTSGRCTVVAGRGRLDDGPDDLREFRRDNYVTTQYNPEDVHSLHLQSADTRDQFVIDEAMSVFFDIDWEVDFAGINMLEIGFKWSERDKENRHGNIQFENTTQTDGDGSIALPRGVPSIWVDEVNDGNFGYDNFLSSQDYPRDRYTDGWPSIDAIAAFDLIFQNEDVTPALDTTNSRQINVEASSVYLKANFAYIDERLSGDIGVRYVETQNTSQGVHGINYLNDRIADIPLWFTLANINMEDGTPLGLTPCATTADLPTDKIYSVSVRNARDAEARANPCFDPVLVANSAHQLVPQDLSASIDPRGDIVGGSESDILLPSFNINFDLTDDFLLRAAVSKTMARPTMDSLQPGFVFSESIWAGTGTGREGNPNLLPLESRNADIAAEWYFNDDGGILSAAIFHKEYSNFEETETLKGYLRDVRDTKSLNGRLFNEFILADKDTSSCFPQRAHLWADYKNPEGAKNFGAGTCREYQISKKINGKGATVNGIEVGYTQNFSFLPGVLSGLGVTANYTYQKTEADRQEGSLPNTFLPEFPLAFSPEESTNATVFWEKDGHLIRIAYNQATDVLLDRSWMDGMALWQDGGYNIDISANYQANDWLAVTFNAVNINDRVTRQYATSVTNSAINNALGLGDGGEGSAFDGASQARTIRTFNTGAIYRIGLRATF